MVRPSYLLPPTTYLLPPTSHLRAPPSNRSVSFSYGKALQKTTIVTWALPAPGAAAGSMPAKSQAAILARSKANSDATRGTYVKGSCASVGVSGNVEQAAGAY